MTFKTTRLRDAISIAIAMTSVAAAGSAFAQNTTATPAPQSGEAQQLDRIEVTGSRIPRADVETAQPIITLSRDQIQAQGFTSVADILQNLTSAGSPAISRADALASGENVGGYYIDLRNLGAARTLVLVNGKRLGITTSGLQDLSQIPVSAIQRIEVLKDGASAIYGSDAIAGVVNVITRRNFDGAEANVYLGSFDQGDGFKQSYDVTLGATGDRASVTLSAEYTKEDPVFAKDREFSKYGNSGKDFPFSGWSAISQNGVWLGNVSPGGVFTAPSCASGLCTVNAGQDPRNPANYHSLTPAERANANLEMMLQTGIERRSVFVSSTLNITDNVKATADIGYTNRSTQQQIAGYPFNYGFGLVSSQSYFNPRPAAGDAYFYRRLWEVPRRTRSELDTLRVSLGLEGVLNFGDKTWDWDIGYLSNRNTVNKYATGDANTLATAKAMGPSFFNAATGRVECGTAANPSPYGSNFGSGQCIPFNPFLPYGQAGQGSLGNPELQAYLFPEYHDAGLTTTTIYSANMGGSLFTLPAGDVGVAFGVEHREEDGRFVPDAFAQAGQSTGLPATTTAGAYSLNEAYVEFEVPVLADVAFAKELTFNVASRYSDYSNFGNTLNSKFSMRWRPMDGLLFRATYAQGFRAPTISDLYGGIGGSFESYTDPCAAGQPGAGGTACTAAGVPATYVQLGQANQPCTTTPCQTNFQFLSGSNPNLKPETATSKTAGVVWSPKWVQGLDFSLDWYNVKIEDTIVSDSVDAILTDCYVNNISSRCAGVVRNPTTHVITDMFFGLTNLGAIRTEGYDFGVMYRVPETSFGKFNVNWQSSYVSKYDTLADNNPDTQWQGSVGYPGYFRLRSNLGLTWEKGDFAVSYMARYYSGMKEACSVNAAGLPTRWCNDFNHKDQFGNADPLNRVGSNTFHDLQASVKLPWNATAAIGANNITNHLGPIMFTTPNSDFPYYGGFDIGRVWYLKYQQRF
ncbi:TonB-dependent receptor plug domain-containing protein [Cognatilysobacter terrigena]|uniref:TonB-dependent receptor plug domain-containing protein n=1 Tax=Cognatilysobacter terrigena TaxID=2488749 RepID=UPI001062180C|nr:TonB-dependent receptor [Lysobacter terrigena]